MLATEREKASKRESEKEGAFAMGASFQVSNTTSGDGFKPNSLPPINTKAKREYINCLTITHFEKIGKRTEGGKKRRYPSGISFS